MRRDVLWSIWKIGRYPIKVSEVLPELTMSSNTLFLNALLSFFFFYKFHGYVTHHIDLTLRMLRNNAYKSVVCHGHLLHLAIRKVRHNFKNQTKPPVYISRIMRSSIYEKAPYN